MYQHHEITIKNKEKALEVLSVLVDEEYCVMFSREEDLYIINYEYSEYSDRNNVVFMSKDEFEKKFIEIEE
jgi:hypothetical protein